MLFCPFSWPKMDSLDLHQLRCTWRTTKPMPFAWIPLMQCKEQTRANGTQHLNTYLPLFKCDFTTLSCITSISAFDVTISDARQPAGYQDNERVTVLQGATVIFRCEATSVTIPPPGIDFYVEVDGGEQYTPNVSPGLKELTFTGSREKHLSRLVCYANDDVKKAIVVVVEGLYHLYGHNL